jgi:hypothetical protein
MKKTIILSGIAALLLGAVIVGATTDLFTSDNFTSMQRAWQPAPDGLKPGQDNGVGTGTHHPGEDCGICHRPGGRAAAYDLAMGGTFYRDRAGRSVLEGGEVILEDYAGKVFTITSNSSGNFWLPMNPDGSSPLASHPYTVSTYHGHGPFVPLYELYTSGSLKGQLKTPANPNDSSTWKYKAWAKGGKTVTPMMSIAGVGGGPTAPRMSCNMHHASLGSRGGLWTGMESTLAAYPAKELSYRKHIFPILRSKCAPCHIPGATHTGLGSKPEYDHELDPAKGVPVLEYSDGLDLMTFEGSSVPSPLYDPRTGAVTGTELVTKMGIRSVVDRANPDASPLLVKTVGGTSHGGGVFWKHQDPDCQAIRQWIAEGALKN